MSATEQERFLWVRHPEAAAWLEREVALCSERCEPIRELAEAMTRETSTRLFDWVDHLALPLSDDTERELEKLGFTQQVTTGHYRLWSHPGAQLPRVALYDECLDCHALVIGVESIEDFLQVRGMAGHIEGTPYSSYRKALIAHDGEIGLWVCERRGALGVDPQTEREREIINYLLILAQWKTRPRRLGAEEERMRYALDLAERSVNLIGREKAAWAMLEAERHYWQCRNRSGQWQKARQDRLGLGWANHDHHTFRSSRRHFTKLVRLFEILGFHCRERFYAGEEAGWGAQVMEHSACRLVLFLDVDLSPEEIAIDFSHQELPELDHLGTIGLWCALHGDSILQSGMHHLEAQFEFDSLRQELERQGFGLMNPFSDFSYLKQAFTIGEIWPVDGERLAALERKGLISGEERSRFAKEGALGSHLENLQRRDGFKGFNQKNVSYIIRKTDPREESSHKR